MKEMGLPLMMWRTCVRGMAMSKDKGELSKRRLGQLGRQLERLGREVGAMHVNKDRFYVISRRSRLGLVDLDLAPLTHFRR